MSILKLSAAPVKEPYQQTSQRTCSAACLKMVLSYYGLNKSEDELTDLIGIKHNGAEGDKIVSAAEKLNFKAQWKELKVSEAIQLLNEGTPIIADMKSWNYPQPNRFHWVVLEDIDIKNDKVHIADPNTPGNRRIISCKELDSRWRSKNMYTGKDMVRAGVVVYNEKRAEEEKSLLRNSLPYLAAAGAGLGTYGLLRRFNPSVNKGLAALQNSMKGKKLNIQVNQAHKVHEPIFGMKPLDKSVKEVPKNIGVLNHSSSTRAVPSDVQINTELASAMDNKVTFDKIMNQGVGFGGSKLESPTAKGTEYFHNVLKEVGGDVNKLKQKYPEFIMKPATGSLGQAENLITNTEHPMFQKIMKDPNMQRNYLIQEKLPIDKEFRVHTINGVPFSVMNRRIENNKLRGLWEKLTGSQGGGAFIPTLGKDRQELKDFVSKAHEHLQPAFEQGHNLHSAYDVAKLKDGTYKLIESNPTPGTLMNPIVNRKLNRMVTGRWGKDVAALGGIGAGAATLGGAKLLDDSK